MKVFKFNNPAGRTSLNSSVVTFLCLLALACVALRLGAVGAGAQVKSQPDAKRASRGAKSAPAVGIEQVPDRSKASGPKETGAAPAVLGCSNPTPTIAFGQTVTGTLQQGDCTIPSDGSFYDAYSFTGTAGQQVVITLTSSQFDAYLFLMRPSETTLSQSTFFDDDSGGGTNARLSVTLPESGTYTILANSFSPGQTGSYTLTLTGGNSCTPTATVISPNTTANGALTSTDCKLDDGSFYDIYTFSGTAGQQVAITMSASFDTYLFLIGPDGDQLFSDDFTPGTTSRIPPGNGFVRLPATGTYRIIANSLNSGVTGNYTISLSVSPNACPSTPINIGETKSGSLATTDCRLPFDGSFIDVYTFNATAGDTISISLTSTSFDTYLFLLDPAGSVLASDDNGGTGGVGGGNTNSRIPATSGTITLKETGTYTIYANSSTAGAIGAYTLTLSGCSTTLVTTTRTVNSNGGTFSDNFTTQAGCAAPTVLSNASWLTVGPVTVNASGQGTFTYTVAPYNPGGDLVSDRVGMLSVGGQIFTVTQTPPAACPVTLTTASGSVGAGNGTFTGNFTVPSGCTRVTVTPNASWITVGAVNINDSGQGTFSYTVQANTTTSARTGTITVGEQTFTVNQAAALACVTGLYPSVQPFTAAGGTGRFTVFASTGCQWQATSNVSWITITTGAPGATNAANRVRFSVAANSGTATRTGTITVGTQTFTVTQTSAGTTPTVQFSNANYSVNENAASSSVTISVSRSGDTTGATTVEYSTVDNTAAVPCDPTLTQSNGQPFPRGTAYARCDYASTIDTLTFLPGETTKTFTIPLINDVHVEGAETFQIALANPQGATLGAPSTATVTINDDDTVASATNPINTTSFFVRQQYLDFLSREPEQGEPWSAVLNGCSNPFNTDPSPQSAGANCDRIQVSSAFFGSPEFRLKGFFVFLYHKASFGSAADPKYVPSYDDFTADSRRVTGATANEVFAKRNDFAEDWVNRPAFKTRYDALSNAQFVDTLLANVNATLSTPDPVSGATRNSLVADLDARTKTRADVLRIIVESQEVNQRQSNFAFVAIQYYGYLRRTPEEPGYTNWLDTLNSGQSDRVMVRGFLYSAEYKRRFGPNTTP